MNEYDHQSNESRKRAAAPRRGRRYLWILLGLLLVLLAVAAAAPSLLSTPPVRDAALGWYNRSIAGEVSAADVSLSWLGGQSAREVVIRDARGEAVLRLGGFETDLTLVDALRGRFTLGRTVASGLDIDLRFAGDGTSNLAGALAGEPGTETGDGGLVAPVTGNMTLVDGRVAVSAPGIDPIVLENLSGDVTMAGLDSPVRVKFSGQSRQGDLQGSIDLDGQIDDLFSNGELTPGSATATVNAGIEDLPVDALDRLLGFRGMLSAALGDRTSVNVRAGGDADSQDISIDARSPNAALNLEGNIADGRFRLRSPAGARLNVTPGLLDVVNSQGPGEPPARLAAPVPLELQIESLDVPLDNFTPAGIALEASLSAGDAVRLAGIDNLGELSINDLQLLVSSPGLGDRIHMSLAGKPVTRDGSGELTLEADIQKLIDDAGNVQLARATVAAQSTITGIPTAVIDSALQQNGLLVDAAGDVFALELNADTDPDGRINISASLDSERVRTGPVQLVVDEQIALAKPARLQLAVTPSLWRRLLGDDALQLTQPSEWILELETLTAPIPGGEAPAFQPAATQVKAAVSSASVQLAAPADARVTRLEQLRIDLDAGDGLDAFDFNGAADILQPGGQLESLNASPLRVSLKGGTGLNDDASLKQITSLLELSGDGLSAAANTVIEEGLSRLTLTGPSRFSLILTPGLVAEWQDSTAPAVTLARDAALQGTLNRLVVPLSPVDYAGLQLSGEAGLDGAGAEPVQLTSPGGAVTRLDNTRVSFEITGADGGQGRLGLDAGVRSDRDESGELALEASATGFLDAAGQPAMDGATLELDGGLQQLPVALLDQLLDMEGTATATLGPTADIELSSRLERMRGPLSISLRAPNARADVKARLGDEGLALSEPLVAQVEPTPEFGSQVLAKVHPIFETTQRAERPIRFEMPAEGVLIPIENYDFGRITVPTMTVDFGKIVLKSGWLVRGIIDLGRRFGKLESVDKEEVVAWFTPGVMEIRDGRILYSRRLDLLLAERLHLATWGAADVAGDRSNLILAFMPNTMERVFSITVPGDDALHIPITGPLSSPSMDLKKAGADLARLRAQEEVSGENPLAGALLGAVTRKATGGGGPVPPPSVTPLPWTEQLKALDAAETREKQSEAPAQAQPESDQAKPEKKPSTEEKVIRGLIDIFGRDKE